MPQLLHINSGSDCGVSAAKTALPVLLTMALQNTFQVEDSISEQRHLNRFRLFDNQTVLNDPCTRLTGAKLDRLDIEAVIS